MVQPARYLVSAEVKVAARRIVSDGCEAMNRPTPLQGSVINAPHSSETDLDATRCRILIGLPSEGRALAVVGQHLCRVLNRADRVRAPSLGSALQSLPPPLAASYR